MMNKNTIEEDYTERWELCTVTVTGRGSDKIKIDCYTNSNIIITDKNNENHIREIRGICDIDFSRHVDYHKYLQSQTWKNKRKKYYQKKFKNVGLRPECFFCRSTEHLNIHHLDYTNIGREGGNDLVCLCEDCHNSLHKYAKKVKQGEINIYLALYELTKQYEDVPGVWDINRTAYIFSRTAEKPESYHQLKDFVAAKKEKESKEPFYGVLEEANDFQSHSEFDSIIIEKAKMQEKIDNENASIKATKVKQFLDTSKHLLSITRNDSILSNKAKTQLSRLITILEKVNKIPSSQG